MWLVLDDGTHRLALDEQDTDRPARTYAFLYVATGSEPEGAARLVADDGRGVWSAGAGGATTADRASFYGKNRK